MCDLSMKDSIQRVLVFFVMFIVFVVPSVLSAGDSAAQKTLDTERHRSFSREQEPMFIPNRGQIVDSEGKPRPDLLYVTNGSGIKMYFRQTGVSYVFARLEQPKAQDDGKVSEATGKLMQAPPESVEEPLVSMYRMDMDLVGSNTNAAILPEEQTEAYFNYYLAHCPEGITEVHGYKRIVYKNVYNNIDLVFHSSKYGVKYDFVVRPGGNVADIQMRYNNAETIGLKTGAKLSITTPLGNIEEEKPVSYAINSTQSYRPLEVNGSPVQSRFIVKGNTVGFDVAEYDTDRTLVIDPYVLWSTFLGSELKEHVEGVAVGAWNKDQQVIVSGWTAGAGFPAWPSKGKEIYQGGTDAFMASLSSEGQMNWYTFFGGKGFDRAESVSCLNPYRYNEYIANNPSYSELYAITGYTNSLENIAGGTQIFQNSYGGGNTDVFVAVFNISGFRQWSTYIGGSGDDYGYDVAVSCNSAVDEIYITLTGKTGSMNFPVLPATLSPSWVYAAKDDAFIIRFDALGNTEWSRYLGGKLDDVALSVDVDANGNTLIGGWTKSNDLPVTVSFPIRNGFTDMLLAMFNPAGELIDATYWGDDADDYCTGVAFSRNGDIIVAGYAGIGTTSNPSSNIYTQFGTPYQPLYGGGTYDGVLINFGSQLINNDGAIWSTPYGGDNDDRIEDIAIDYYGDIWVVGRTNSTESENIADAKLIGYEWDPPHDDWLEVQDGRHSSGGTNYDTFIAKFNPEGERTWSSYYGKSGSNIGVSIASGQFYGIALAGWTHFDHTYQIPVFHANASLQPNPYGCDEGFVLLMREFGFPTSYPGLNYDLDVDSQDRIVSVGYTASNNFPVSAGAYQATLESSINAIIVKFDPNGAPIWSTFYGGITQTIATAVSINTDDDILVGTVQGNGALVNHNNQSSEGHLALFNQNGLLINSLTINGSLGATTGIRDVGFAPDGGLYAFGYTNSTASTGYSGGYDGFIAKYSAGLANLEWWKYWGGTQDDLIEAAVITPDNELVVVGRTFNSSSFHLSSGYHDKNNPADIDAFVSKFDCSGNNQWSRLLGGIDTLLIRHDYASDVDVAPNGKIVVIGTTTSADFPITSGAYQSQINTNGNCCERDIFLTILTPSNGAIEYSTFLGGAGSESASSLVIDDLGSIVILGQTNSIDYPVVNAIQPTLNVSHDLCITKFNSMKQLEWSTYFGSRSIDGPIGAGPGGSVDNNQKLAAKVDSNNNIIAHTLWQNGSTGYEINSREAVYFFEAYSIFTKLTTNGQFWSAP